VPRPSFARRSQCRLRASERRRRRDFGVDLEVRRGHDVFFLRLRVVEEPLLTVFELELPPLVVLALFDLEELFAFLLVAFAFAVRRASRFSARARDGSVRVRHYSDPVPRPGGT
jgi:hypothetical protein